MLVAVFMLCLISSACFAQLDQFEDAVETQANSFRNIITTIIDVVFAIGAVRVVYAYATKSQDARDYLIYFGIACAVYAIIRQAYLTAA